MEQLFDILQKYFSVMEINGRTTLKDKEGRTTYVRYYRPEGRESMIVKLSGHCVRCDDSEKIRARFLKLTPDNLLQQLFPGLAQTLELQEMQIECRKKENPEYPNQSDYYLWRVEEGFVPIPNGTVSPSFDE